MAQNKGSQDPSKKGNSSYTRNMTRQWLVDYICRSGGNLTIAWLQMLTLKQSLHSRTDVVHFFVSVNSRSGFPVSSFPERAGPPLTSPSPAERVLAKKKRNCGTPQNGTRSEAAINPYTTAKKKATLIPSNLCSAKGVKGAVFVGASMTLLTLLCWF